MNLFHAQVLAEEILFLQGLRDWSFRFDNAKKRFGQCNYRKKEITLSKYLTQLNSQEIVQNTIIHEVSHAIAGYESGHGKKWKDTMKKLGGNPSRCYGEEVITPPLKYTATCPQCNTSFQRKIKRQIACKSCCKTYNKGKFTPKFLFIFSEN